MVYSVNEPVPSGTHKVGVIGVRSNNSWTSDYSSVLKTAVKKTAKYGGNILKVKEYKSPDGVYLDYGLYGSMLRTDTINADTLVKYSLASLIGSHKKDKMILKLSAGPAWITSKMYTSSGVVTGQPGFELSAEMEILGRGAWGFGVNTNYNRTHYDNEGHVSLFYLGPNVIYEANVAERLRMSYSLGFGVSMFRGTDKVFSGGIGLNSAFGMEVKLSSHFGIGAELQGISTYIFDDDDNGLPDDTVNGVVRMGLLIGGRFYF